MQTGLVVPDRVPARYLLTCVYYTMRSA